MGGGIKYLLKNMPYLQSLDRFFFFFKLCCISAIFSQIKVFLTEILFLKNQVVILGSDFGIQVKYFWKKHYFYNFQFVSII